MSDLATPPSSAPQSMGGGQPVRPRSVGRRILGIFLLIAFVAAMAALIVYVRRTSPGNAAVGDCVRRSGGDSVAVVPCDDPEAEFEVVGRVEDQTEIEAGITTCSPFAEQGATQIYWEGEQSGTGFVLCLAEHDA